MTGIQQASATFGDTTGRIEGVILEVAIPLSAVQIVPTEGHVFGVEMDYNDDDNGGERDTKLKTYSTTDDTWQDPRLMRPAKMIAATAGELMDVREKASRAPDFALCQNYPNPFNPDTEILFSIPNPQKVKLTVFDARGRKIRILADDFRSAGRHSVTFRADGLASGVYLYRLETSDRIVTKKMLLMK
jgi:hypothetical protein